MPSGLRARALLAHRLGEHLAPDHTEQLRVQRFATLLRGVLGDDCPALMDPVRLMTVADGVVLRLSNADQLVAVRDCECCGREVESRPIQALADLGRWLDNPHAWSVPHGCR